MIELYGNKIWNSNTPNKYKKVIIASEDSLDNICQELENSGLNYCAYIFNGEAHIAIGRATANNIDKLDIDYQTVIECNSKVYKTNNIIGTTTYDSIEDKLYRKYNTDFAYKIGQRLTEQGILFSGRIYGKTTTITVDKQYADTLNKISAELKEQRASFMSKSEVVQNESPEESKSVNEKISELHFNESQLSALAPSVKFIQTRNDDNLTDNFVSLFSDCTDFYESQLSALAEIYVDTYRSFSDKSLIFADTSRFNDLKQRFVNDNITAKLTENRGYSTTQFEIIREMVTYGMSESVINLLDYTFSIDEMQNFFTAYKNGSYEDLINLIADIKGTTRTDIEGQIEGGTYTPALPDFNTLEKTLYFQESEVESITYMYYNPDAYSGGQFVITEVSYKQIAEANKEYGDDFSGFFDFLDTTGEQRLIDIGSESFRTAIKKFYSGTEFAEGLNADIQHKLVELAVVPEIKLPEVRKIELIKVGDFYEVRGENAKTVADILDLVSTTRNINGSSVDTVGFPDFKLNDNTELLKTQGFTVNIKYEELAPFYEEHDELDDIDPAVIRQQLEDAGIVNGELVDEDKLNSDPFIQQVMAVAESDAGALNVSSEEIVNQFNSENEIVPINEPEQTESVQEIIRPTITCDWSESPVFENGKTYSVSEFDKLMKNADDEWVEQRQLEIEEYGSENAVAEAYRNGELDNIHLGYEKTKFIINMPNGTKYTERQDIGDGIGGVIDFLEQYSQYSAVVKLLKDDIAKEEQAAEYPEKESNAEKNNNNTELNSIDELAMQLENDEKSTSEKSSVGKNNFIWTSADEHAPVTSQPTLFDSIPVSDVSSDETTSHENYVLEDRESVTGAKTKYRNNITAIKVLKQIEAEYRTATLEEQKQLSLYSGWGGLANAFKSAGTEVTPDIIFLQKRSAPLENIPSWVNVGTTENGLSINNYFIEHPEMVLGDIVQGNKLYGRTDDTMCVPFADGRPLSQLLPEAVKNIVFTYSPAKEVISPVFKTEAVISKPEGLRSQSYYKSGNEIYFYGSNSAGELVTVSAKDLLDKKYTTKNIDRLTAFMEIRDTLRELLEVQQHDNNDAEVEQLQHRLNTIYDNFYDKYGLIHSRYNRNILGFDGAYQLVASLEQDYDKNTLIKKSDIFTQRVNVPKPQIEHIDTASEALAVCIAEKGYIDFDYMSNLTDIDKASLEESLRNNGEIYPIPMNTENNEYTYQTASEYLSGDIYAKLDTAESYAAVDNIYSANVTALKAALPTPLKAGDIDVNLGATWIAPEYYEQFMYKLFETPLFNRSDGIFKDSKISVEYSEYSGKWFISHKAADKSVTVTKTYGACGYSGYQILEAALNLSEPKVYKDKLDEYGRIMFDKNNKPIRVIDVPATQVVQQKANKIRREFKNWLFSDPVRRSDIVDTYNRTFNCIKPREYDGSHLTFPGMNSNIELHEHQKNAIAHAIYGGNTLFAHSVGAGKTFEMIATAMECKRLGLCHKSLFAVPNHLTEQVGADFLKLYPNANILVATKDDFKAENRKRLMSKIATGNYDAVIIGHTQLKMLPLSPERQENIFKEQIDNIVAGIAELKYQEGNSFKVKDMERTKRSLEQQLEKLQSSKKDNTVYFEELGIDKLFVDEAHEFKNLFCTTKLQNVSGISSRASQRATELFAKCRYLDEKTGGKGVVFATGTPLSNSVTELHTMMRYLNYDFLASHNNMQNFDNWVSTFGVQKKEYELAPAGNKFKERTRIAEYANLPELMSMFKTIADVRTADTLNLKVPDCELHIVDVEPTELQTELVEELSDRADEVNNGSVDPSQDNMLKITGDGRKLGLDPRLINPSFEDDPGTKLNVCVNNVFDIYEKTSDKKLTQIVFCDLGVPSKNSSADGNKDDDTKSVAELDSLEESGKFCVYDDIRDKLIAKGVSADEIAYIHNAKSETQKSELFAKVRSGEVRILLGSTGKMGTGTNVQDRIIALHDLDVPWRPSDLEQRRGRMVRQGNINDKVHLYRYVTKGTFDAYSYQLLEKKQKFISQIMTSKEPGRKCADVDQAALTYSEIKALCTGDERIREKLTLENRVKELQALKSEYNSTRYELEDKVNAYPEERKKLLLDIGNISKDMETVKNIPFDVKTESYRVKITIGKDAYSLLDDESRKVAAKALTNAVAQVKGDANKNKRIAIGELGNFGVEIINDGYFLDKITATLRGNYTYSVELGVSSIINLKKIENLLFKVENVLNDKKSELNKLDIDYKTAQNMLHKPFEFDDELNNSTKRLDELTTALNIDMSEHKVDKPKKTHYFGKDFILGKNKSSKQIQNNEVMKSEPKRSEQEL